MKRGPRDDPRAYKEALRIVTARTRAGDSAAQIAVQLRCNARTVQRYRMELRAAGVHLELPPRPGPTHGLPSTYNHGCRCDPCREAHRRHMAHQCTRPVTTHGALGYKRGGRCPVCFGWQSAHNRTSRQRRLARQETAA